MMSIEKDLRDLVEKWEAIAITLKNGFQLEHGARGANARESARVRKDCAADLESLIPRIVAAVEQAQAEAIQSAAEKPNMLSNPQVIAEKMPSCSTPIAVASVCEAITKSILSLTPRRVQIEAELRVKKAIYVESEWWNDYQLGKYTVDEAHKRNLDNRDSIATLERELEAERKGVQK